MNNHIIESFHYFLGRWIFFGATLTAATACFACDLRGPEGTLAKGTQQLVDRDSTPLWPRPTISRDGKSLLYSCKNKGRLQLVELDIARIPSMVRSRREIAASFPFYSPAGDGICLSQLREGTHLANIGFLPGLDADVDLLTQSDVLDTYPSFSKDGQQIVFARANRLGQDADGGNVWWDWDVWCVDRNGNEKRMTTHEFARMSPPYFSPDRSRIVYAADPFERDVGIQMRMLTISETLTVDDEVVLQPPTSQQHKHGVKDMYPSFSPSGEEVVFVSDQEIPYRYEIWLLNLSTKSRTRITNEKVHLSYPMFAPDGMTIYFFRDDFDDRHPALWRIQSDGNSPELVAVSPL